MSDLAALASEIARGIGEACDKDGDPISWEPKFLTRHAAIEEMALAAAHRVAALLESRPEPAARER